MIKQQSVPLSSPPLSGVVPSRESGGVVVTTAAIKTCNLLSDFDLR